MDRERIDEVVCEIMRHDGPDRHVDGHEVITDFIVAAIEGRGERWAETYANYLEARKRKREEQDAYFKSLGLR
jgi:hypothetical protein